MTRFGHGVGRGGAHAERGFSVIEMMVVIAIIGILAAMAIPNWNRMMEKYKVEDETKRLYGELMLVRAQAMQTNRLGFVTITSPTTTTRRVNTYLDTAPTTSMSGDGALDTASDKNLSSMTTAHAIDVTGITGVSPYTFGNDGLATFSGTIRLISTVSPDYDCISIAPTRIRMGQYTGGACVTK